MKNIWILFSLLFSSFIHASPSIDYYILTKANGFPIEVTRYVGNRMYVHLNCVVVLHYPKRNDMIKGCATWNSDSCLIFTIDNPDVLEHEERHCREGNFH